MVAALVLPEPRPTPPEDGVTAGAVLTLSDVGAVIRVDEDEAPLSPPV